MDTRVHFASDPAEIWDSYDGYSGNLAFDIGANGGLVSYKLSKHFETVVACEPCDESFAYLVADAPPNVQCCNVAVSDHVGKVTLNEAEQTMAMGELVTGSSLESFWGTKTGERTVPATTVDQLVKVYGTPDFVKIDTEGHELPILRGAKNTLIHHPPRLIVEVHNEADGHEIEVLLWDYQLRRVDHPLYRAGTYSQRNHYYLVGEPA